MWINYPLCDLKTCRKQFDGNCIDKRAYEDCPYMNPWILVTERLPEKDGRYLITDTTDGAKTQEGYFCRTRDGEPYWGYLHVIAWMPLHEPYKEETT